MSFRVTCFLCGTGLNHGRLQKSSKTWEKIFSRIKMDSWKYSMYSFFFDSGRCFYSMYRFFLPIPEDAFGGRNYRFCILCMPSWLYIYIIYNNNVCILIYKKWIYIYILISKYKHKFIYINIYIYVYVHIFQTADWKWPMLCRLLELGVAESWNKEIKGKTCNMGAAI